jgi:colanic acid biosynthesis glycosyl transferase WcaI
MARILFLTLVFPPDGVSTAQVMGDLARDLRARGHAVDVLTTAPHYNRDAEAEARQPLRPFWGPVLKKSDFHGIPVTHTMMPKKGRRVMPRLFAWMGFHVLSTIAGLTVLPKPDLIFAPSPPLTIGLGAWLIGRFRRAPYLYNVQEIYPDIAIRLGALRSRRIIRLLHGLERFVYRRAAKITVIAPRMLLNLLGKGVPRNKLVLIPNFADVDDLRPLPKDNSFSRRYGLHDMFTVSYAGNLGAPQGLDTFLEAAALLRNEPGLRFLMLGDGMQKEPLRRHLDELRLASFQFLPHQPYSLVPQIYASSDANLVPQAAETGCDAVPSKVYRIMACGRPVLAVTDPASDLAQLVREAACGAVVVPGSAPALAQTILWAYRHQAEWRARGEAGRLFVTRHYSRSAVADRYDLLVRTLVAGVGARRSR